MIDDENFPTLGAYVPVPPGGSGGGGRGRGGDWSGGGKRPGDSRDDQPGDAEDDDAKTSDAAKSDAPKGAAAKSDAAKSDAAKSDAAKGDAAKGDAAKGDAPKGDAAKPAATRAGASAGEAAARDAVKADALKSVAAASDPGAAGPSSPAARIPSAPMAGAPKLGEPSGEPRSDTLDVDVPWVTLASDADKPVSSVPGTSSGAPRARTEAWPMESTPGRAVPAAARAPAPPPADTFPATQPATPEPGMQFLSTTGDPDTYQPPSLALGDEDESTRFSERFEVVKLLGKGGMGRVYRVRDRHIQGRELALKILHRRFSESPYFKDLFFREIKTAQEFVSEHVNQVRDTGITDDGQLFLTMDLVDGETLRAILRRETTLGVRHALEIVRQVLLGLQSGHEQGFIHRDVKPENIMLVSKVPKTDDNPFGVGVRLLDFGLAGLAAELEEGGTHGTPMYMSPEQAQGKRLDGRSDLFSVGTVLYEMLVGSRPFHGKTVANVLTSVIETDVQPLIDQIEHVDKRVRKLLRKALAKKREDRFQSASEFITAIEKAPAFRPATEMPLWGTAALVVLAAGAAAGGGLWWTRDAEIRAARASNDMLRSEVAARDSRIQDLQGLLSAAQEKVAEKGDTVVSARVDDETLKRMQADLESEKSAREDLRAALEAKLAESNRRIAELSATSSTQETELQKLKRLERQTQPVPKAARGLDDILRLAEGGHLDQVEGYVTSLALADAFKGDPLKGRDHLRALGALCAAIHAFGQTAGDETRQQIALSDAEAALKGVRSTRGQFEIVAKDYLTEPTEENPSPDRLARLDAVVADLDARVATMRESAAAGSESAWEAFLAAGAEQDPEPVFALAAQTGAWDSVQAILEAYAADLEQRAVTDGRLSIDALRADPWLDAWAARIEKQSQVRDWTHAKDVRLMAFARAWNDNEEPRALTIGELNLPSAPLISPRADWRWEAHLKAQVALDRAAWPLDPTKEAVYLRTSPTGNQWVKDRGDRRAGSDGWIVSRSIYRERADKVDFLDTSDFTYELHDGRTFGWQGGSLDIRSDTARIARFEPSTPRDVPNQLGVTPDEVAAFRARLATADASERACLVFVDGRTTRWISPVLGLVREEQDSNGEKIVLELVYTNVLK